MGHSYPVFGKASKIQSRDRRVRWGVGKTKAEHHAAECVYKTRVAACSSHACHK